MIQPAELVGLLKRNIRLRRLELGMTQLELAKLLKAHQPYVAALEKGSATPSIEKLAQIANALRTTPDALLSENIFSEAS